MVMIVRNTSTICSALNRLILTIKAQNVPERPTPSLNKKYNVPTYISFKVVGLPAVDSYGSIASFTLDTFKNFYHINYKSWTVRTSVL